MKWCDFSVTFQSDSFKVLVDNQIWWSAIFVSSLPLLPSFDPICLSQDEQFLSWHSVKSPHPLSWRTFAHCSSHLLSPSLPSYTFFGWPWLLSASSFHFTKSLWFLTRSSGVHSSYWLLSFYTAGRIGVKCARSSQQAFYLCFETEPGLM